MLRPRKTSLTEVEAYHMLKEVWGKYVPRLVSYGTIVGDQLCTSPRRKLWIMKLEWVCYYLAFCVLLLSYACLLLVVCCLVIA